MRYAITMNIALRTKSNSMSFTYVEDPALKYAMALVTQEIINPTPIPRRYVLLLSIFSPVYIGMAALITIDEI